jgi:cytochrome oxidase Cu insertion factor (SCO1/SenC/PrrC family)
MKVNRFVRLLGVMIALLAFGAGCSESAPPRDNSVGSSIKEGDTAPAFALPTSDGGEVSLPEFRGKKAVLLYFSMGPG